jgi:TP901 family phage tail tape measure protein
MDRDLRVRIIMQKLGDLVGPLRAIGGQARTSAGQIRETQQELNRLKQVQSRLSGFREMKGNLAGTTKALAESQQYVNDLAKAINAAEKPTKQMSAEFARAKTFAAALKEQHGEQSAELQNLRDQLKEAGLSTRDLVAGERDLRKRVEDTTKALEDQRKQLGENQKLEARRNQQRRDMERAQATAQRLAVGGAAAVGTGIAILAPLQASIGTASRFQAVMTSVAQNAGITRAEATKLGLEIASIGPKVNQLPSDLARGADSLAALGLDAKGIPPLLTAAGKAATAYGSDIDDVARASFAVADNLKVPFEQSARAIDIMANAGKAGAFELKDMAGFFPALTAAAQGLGQTGAPAVADLAAALQITRKGAGDASTAANNLQNLMAKITAPATVKKFKDLGVDLPAALNKAYAEGKTPIEAISELVNKTLGGDMSRLGQLFEDMQVQQALRPLIANLDLYRKIRSDALNASGEVERDYIERLLDSGQASQALEVVTESLQIKLGTVLLPTMVRLATGLSDVLDRVTAWTDANPGLTNAIAIGAGVLGALLVVVGSLAIAIGGILGPFAALRFGLLTIAPAAWAAMVPFLPWVAAIAVLIAIGVALYNHWDQIAGFFAGLGARFAAALAGAWAAISGFGQRLGTLGQGLGGFLIQGIITGLFGPLPRLLAAVTGIAGRVATTFRERLGIRSPSRLFAEYGGHLMAGLANGIDGGAAGPVARIGRLSRDMTAALAVGASVASPAAANPLGGGLGSGVGGGQTVLNVTINVAQQPGQSGPDLARMVAEELARVQREADAARRSAFRDYGE